MIRLFRRNTWDLGRVTPPWGDRPSIHRHLAARARTPTETSAAHAPREDDGLLPDEAIVRAGSDLYAETGVYWGPGVRDGVLGPPEENEQIRAVSREILAALGALAEDATDERAGALYALVSTRSALDYLDTLLSSLHEHPTLGAERVRAIGRWLASGAADREAVKCGIALIGVVTPGEAEDRDRLMVLGAHGELTLYAAVALRRTQPDGDPLVCDLARQQTGWGRVHAIRQLMDTTDPGVKAWLVREGCRNDVEDAALICAQTGDLAGALRTPTPDAALMEGAGHLLAMLADESGAAAGGMHEYPDAHEATSSYLDHLRTHDATPAALHAITTLRQFIEGERDSADEASATWRASADRLLAWIDEITARPDWPAKIRAELAQDDATRYWYATQAAGVIGLDIWQIHVDGLQRGEDRWAFAARTDDPARLEQVVRIAERQLPLEQLASGPGDEGPLGAALPAHNGLMFVLQELHRLPGQGWPIIRAGLRSPVVSTRVLAARTLGLWPRTAWPDEAEPRLRAMLADEPDAGARG